MTRSYSELSQISDYMDRFRYLAIKAQVGEATFGHERFLNQDFYHSRQWRLMRNEVIARDYSRDLGCEGYDLHSLVVVHHMNPMSREDIALGREAIMDPEFLITTTHKTHNAIHYGSEDLLPQPYVERRPGDTTLWAPRRS